MVGMRFCVPACLEKKRRREKSAKNRGKYAKKDITSHF